MSLEAFFSPRHIVLIGATERAGSVGRSVVENLASFRGELFFVNARRAEVLGKKAFASVADLPFAPDLAVIVTPAATVPGLIEEAGKKGISAVVVISAGFKEVGEQGAELERAALSAAKRHGVRVIGPNCLGLLCPHTGLNASFAANMAKAGRVAFLSQSGALCTAILDWSLEQNVGFSAFVSTGAMMDVGWAELIRFFGEDTRTQSIVMYLESVGSDAAGFLAAAREVAGKKPLIVIKVGRSAEASRAAASHTGAMTGSDAVFDAALRQSGVLRVDQIEELFDLAEVLAKQPLPLGPRLGIVTNAGGPGALATDALVLGGGRLAELSEVTLAKLDEALPAAWSHQNPVDVLGDADAQRFTSAVEKVMQDAGVDGVLAILTPQAMTEPTATAHAMAHLSVGSQKPLLASWMGAKRVHEARGVLNAACISTYDYPDEAVRSFVSMHERQQRLVWREETLSALRDASLHPKAFSLPKKSGLLTEVEAKNVLADAGIPVVQTRAALDVESAVEAAEKMGFPVVVKLLSPTITHKSDVGGVCLNLLDSQEVRKAWQEIRSRVSPADFGGVTVQRMISISSGTELILGMSRDPQFGPVLLFGAGGTLVEVMQDRVLALPPLNHALSRRWIMETRIHRVLEGVRGQARIDFAALETVITRFSDLVLAAPSLLEADLNPLLATVDGVVVLDARLVLADESREGQI